jgi:mono/diheme cytochrome c family protein
MYQFIKSLGPSDKPSRPALPPDQKSQTFDIGFVPAAPMPGAPLNQKEAGVHENHLKAPLTETLARGKYMVVTGHCNNCHTADYGAREGNVPEQMWLKGSPLGHKGPWGTTYPTNLRIMAGKMTEAEWVFYARSVKPRPPMPWWSVHETDVEDLGAMYQFIKTLGPAGDPAPASLPPDQEPTPPYVVWPPIFPN